MKKVPSMLLIAMMLVGMLAGCGSGEGENHQEPVTIVGTWEYGSLGAAYIFNADGTGAYEFAGTQMKFTYTDDGSKITLQYEGMTAPNEFNYTIEGNILHMEDSFGEIVDYTKK